ncbi:MAG: molybdopterin dehydrogenase [Spirochaetales bacterium]|nr:molybdopterin dehydrogenase [Spirochaetales bacterium]
MIHQPRTLGELSLLFQRIEHPLLWAGGTYLMSRSDFYPFPSKAQIVDLGRIEELKRISRTDRHIDIGAMVTTSSLLSAGKLVLPSILKSALGSIISHITRRQITIGGSVCEPESRMAFSTALAVLDAQAEIRKWDEGRFTAAWIPVNRLYDKRGALLLGKTPFVLTKIRLGLEWGDFQRFVLIDNPIRTPDTAILVAFQATRNQTALTKVRFSASFPKRAFHLSPELENQLSLLNLPIHPDRVNTISYEMAHDLMNRHESITEFQAERTRRVFESFLHELNIQTLS